RLPELLALLREYERGRSKQSTFAAYAPRLLAVLSGVGGPDPKRAEAALKLSSEGVAAYAAGNTAKAVELLSRAESLDPDLPAASLSLGVSLEKLGRREAALAAYGRAIKRALADPRRHWEVAAAALSSRATALEAAGRGREARRDLQSARELAPEDWPGRDEIDRRLRRGAAPR
ncbi:MAG: tetratricopeptide repeat protein, partial [Elusimicrobiota bacterium]